MKKIISMTALFFLAACMASCESVIDKEQLIKSRISALQTAINGHDYDGYMTCFDDGADMQLSYFESVFDSDYPSGTTYSFGSLTIAGSTASCDSTKSTTGTYTYKNIFTMVESGGDWYISVWQEDTSTIFHNKQFRTPVQQ
jgi:hypothetical protein